MPTIVTHKYEFPSENPIATFGAGWTLVGSVTRPLFFGVGTSLDEIIAQINDWQDVGTEAPLTKQVVTHQIQYTRLYGTDVVTITYPILSSDADPVISVSGNITPTEQAAFIAGTVGSGWVVTNTVQHAVVTHTATTSRKRSTSTNPRFLCGLEAVDYVRIPKPSPVQPPPPPPLLNTPGAPSNIFAELVMEPPSITTPGAPSNIFAELIVELTPLYPPIANFNGEIVPPSTLQPQPLLDTFSVPSAFWLTDHQPQQYDPTAYVTDSGHIWFRNNRSDVSWRDPENSIMSVTSDGFLSLGAADDYYAISSYELPPGNFYVEISFQQVQSSSQLLSLTFRAKAEPNPWCYSTSYAEAFMRIDPGNAPNTGYYQFYHGGGSGGYSVTGDNPFVNGDLPVGTHTYRVEVIGNVVTTIFDGVPMITGTLDVYGDDFSTSGGYVGFGIATYNAPHINISKISAGPL